MLAVATQGAESAVRVGLSRRHADLCLYDRDASVRFSDYACEFSHADKDRSIRLGRQRKICSN
jgi:hypothetical protein